MIQTQQESFEFELVVYERDNVKSPNNHKESAAGSVDGFVEFRHDVTPQLKNITTNAVLLTRNCTVKQYKIERGRCAEI